MLMVFGRWHAKRWGWLSSWFESNTAFEFVADLVAETAP